MSTTIRVLLAEDNPADADLAVRELKRAGLHVTHQVVADEPAFGAALREFAPEVILSDFSMPSFDGMAALAVARELRPDVPFIFVSGTIGEEYAIRALKNGATDYVLKDNLKRLPVAVERALADAQQRRRIARLSRIRDFSSQINWALVRLRDRQELFSAICRIAVEVGGLRGARIGLLEGPRSDLRWLAWHGSWKDGAGPDPLPSSAREDDESGRGLAGRALRSLAPAISNDISADEAVRNREGFAAHGIKAIAAFPLVVDGAAAGLLGLLSPEVEYFDHEEVRLFAETAANISFALELIAKQDQLAYLARYDVLTGLPNRSLFQERLSQAIQSAQRNSTLLALALIDLERFQAINDTMGRQRGDEVLQGIAQRLRERKGDTNRLARLGSDLFAVMFDDIASAEDMGRRLHTLASALFGAPLRLGDQEIRLAAKSGVAVYPDDGHDADALLKNAEASLKRAKETGERYQFYAPHINARVAEQVRLESELHKAVDTGELFLHYQPKVDLRSRRVTGLEALLRWKAPDGKLVSPAEFVPVLERTGLIVEAGRQAIAGASAAFRAWQARGLNPPRIAVNISALQLRRASFVSDVVSALAAGSADGGGLDIEITESLLMSEVYDSIRKLQKLREMGIRIALDDFGTGYSSLAYLSKLPVDTLKIDRAFVRGITENAEDKTIVATIISLARALGLKVVAEGVETERQARLLVALRCDQAQGYVFSPPVAAESINAMLQAPVPSAAAVRPSARSSRRLRRA